MLEKKLTRLHMDFQTFFYERITFVHDANSKVSCG